MKNNDVSLAVCGGDTLRHLPYDSREQTGEPEGTAGTENFEHEGIRVRILFAGTADLDELVRGLFMNG